MTPRPARVAFIGLGAMGQRVAGRLLGAGYALRVWNRTASKAEGLVARGAALASTPAGAARGADLVITMVADPAALRDVSQGADGIAGGVAAETTLMEMSTVGPFAVAQLSSALPPAARLIDAPVLGSLAEAENGTLTILVGGDGQVVERWTPLLRALGRPIHIGPVGAGAAAKLVANSALLSVIVALGEALALADALGLARDKAYEVLAATPLAAQAERRRPSIEAGDYPPRFKLALAAKDAALITDVASTSETDLRVADAARAWLVDADRIGFGDRDYTAVLAHILRQRKSGPSGRTPPG
jgi:3-hydroxyisobutyrate dehydrogenase/2-hydroxy-3-oxopropionate reductase